MIKRRLVIFLIICVFGYCGCKKENVSSSEVEPSVKEKRLNSEQDLSNKDFEPFYVYSDKNAKNNHYVPSGFMPDGQCVRLNENWLENCQSGSTCIQINFDVACSRESQRWSGVYWLHPANNWGKREGGFNLSDAKKLTFWARGDKGGEQIQEFTIGGISGDFPDSDMASIGPVILTTDWRQYTIDLRGKDLSTIIGGFSWSTSEDVNPNSCVFYLDDIRYE